MNPAKKHPNTIVSLVSSFGLGPAVVAVCQHWLGWKLSTNDGLYVAGGLSAAALFVGRNGLVGTWDFVSGFVLHGTNRKKRAAKKHHAAGR